MRKELCSRVSIHFVRGSSYFRRLRRGPNMASGSFRCVFGLCNVILLCGILDFVLRCCALGDQQLDQANLAARPSLIGSACSQQIQCEQLDSLLALCHGHGSNSVSSAGADSACQCTLQAHVAHPGSRQHLPLSSSASDIPVTDRRGAQFCCTLFLEQLLPPDAPPHLADSFWREPLFVCLPPRSSVMLLVLAEISSSISPAWHPPPLPASLAMTASAYPRHGT